MMTLAQFSWRRSAVLVLAPLAVLVSACSTTSGSGSGTSTDLAGTGWTVTRVDGRDPVRGEALTADFGVDGRVNGHSGCNTFSGPYIQSGSTVRFGELMSTRRACVDTERQRQENRILAILNGPTTVRHQRDRLTVRGQAGTLVFTRNHIVTARELR